MNANYIFWEIKMKYKHQNQIKKHNKLIAMIITLVVIFNLIPQFVMPVSAADHYATDETELQSKINAAAPGDVIAVRNDIDLTGVLTIGAGKDITITSDMTAAGAPFTLTQNATTTSTSVTNITQRHFSISGSLTLEGIIISGIGSTSTNYNGGVFVKSGGIFTINSGLIIRDCCNISGGGVYVDAGGKFFMNGGTIRDNVADGPGRTNGGGGIYVNSNGIFTMYGGAISGNQGGAYGGGVFIYGGTDTTYFYFYSGTIGGGDGDANTCSEFGGGVYIFSGVAGTKNEAHMYGGKITGNKSTRLGGGLMVYTLAANTNNVFNMYDGEISNNVSNKGGGGIYFDCSISYSGSLGIFNMGDPSGIIAGNPVISGNTAEYAGGLSVSGGNAKFNMNAGVVSGNKVSRYGGGLYGTGDSTLTLQEGSSITGNLASLGGGVYLEYNSVLTINGCSICGNGADTGGGVYMFYQNVCTMNSGEINGNAASGYAGDVYIYNNGAFTMNGGTISGNGKEKTVLGTSYTRTSYGGGVYMSDYNSVFTMNDGTIDGNKSAYGGGLFMSNKTTFTMSGGTVGGDEGNTAENIGGGIYSGGSVIIKGDARIIENKAPNGGGGIWVTDLNNLTVGKDVTFTGNTAQKAVQSIRFADRAIHDANIETTSRSINPFTGSQFEYLYNNYDVNYTVYTVYIDTAASGSDWDDYLDEWKNVAVTFKKSGVVQTAFFNRQDIIYTAGTEKGIEPLTAGTWTVSIILPDGYTCTIYKNGTAVPGNTLTMTAWDASDCAISVVISKVGYTQPWGKRIIK